MPFITQRLFFLFLVLLLSILSSSLPIYPARLPNGMASLRPNSGLTCLHLGHTQCIAGTPRNSFGLDFAAADRQWTKELCEKDSDGDGLSNGQELGDPCCTWSVSEGGELRMTALSHPGNSSSMNSASTVCNQQTTPLPTSSSNPSPSPSVSVSPILMMRREERCGDVFDRQKEKRLMCGRIFKMILGNNIMDVKISIKRNSFRLRASSFDDYNIMGYGMKFTTELSKTIDIDNDMIFTQLQRGKKTLIRYYTEQRITEMKIPIGKSSCCGKDRAKVALKIRACKITSEEDSNDCEDFKVEEMLKIRCGQICKNGNEKIGTEVLMSETQNCPKCVVEED